MKYTDMVGKTFGALTVIGLHSSNRGKRKWNCLCVCGNTATPLTANLTRGNTTNCGCIGRQNRIKAKTTHGMYGTPEYRAWSRAKRRCNSPSVYRFDRYGGRGIKMDPRWENDFAQFFADMGKCPPGFEIDRIDNDGPYAPGNCRWTSHLDQTNNRSSNRYVEWKGERLSHAALARKEGIDYHAFRSRLYAGWSLEKAVTHPFRVLNRRATA